MLRKSDVSDELVARQRTETEALSPAVKESKTDGKDTLSQSSNTSAHTTTLPPDKQQLGPSVTKLPDFSTNDVNSSLVSGGFASGRDSSDATTGKMEEMTHSHFMPTSIQETQILDGYDHIVGGTVTSQTSETTANTSDESDSRDSQSDFGLGTPRSRTPSPTAQFGLSDVEDDLLSFENQRPKDPEIALNKNKSSHDSHLSCHSNINSTRHKADASISSHLDRQVVDKICNFPNGHSERILKAPEVNNAEHSNFFSDKDTKFPVGRFDGERNAAAFNMDQNSMLSKILSIDPWHESLYSPQNLAKFLGLNDKQQGSIGVPRKTRTRSQSWFSFAREEVPSSQASGFGQSADEFTANQCFSGIGNSFQFEKLDACYGFPFFNGMESEIFSGNHSHMSSNRMPVLRPQVAAPPGFAVPSQTPVLGFTSHDRTNQIFDDSGNHQPGANSMLRHNNYEMPSAGNAISNGDIELIDPAILAVGKGLLPSCINNSGLDDLRTHYSSQLNAYEEAKFQSILQRSLPSHHSQRFSGVGESFSLLGDAYSTPSRVMDQTIANNMSQLSHFTLPQSMNAITTNRQWDGWNELQVGNNLGMAEIQMNERLGFNKL